jgi:endonuclease/exonuclease/phosphatase family metal-dependent hydrolase
VYSSAVLSSQDEDLVVVSWNTHVGAGDLKSLVDALRRGDFTAHRPIHQFVLLLQEMSRSGGGIPLQMPPHSTGGGFISSATPHDRSAGDMQSLARRLAADVVYVPSMRNGPGASDRGNAIVSTLPIQSLDLVELPIVHQRRVAIAATLGSPAASAGPQLRVVSVHLDTAIALTRGGPARWRERQTRALLDSVGAGSAPTVIGGDFNTWWGYDEPAVKIMRTAFPDAVNRRSSAPTWRGPLGSESRLDHIFAGGFRNRVPVERVADSYGSDHHPLVAVVKNRTTLVAPR